MKSSQWLSCLFTVLLLACGDGSDPGISYFEVAVEDGYINAGSDVWVFIHNSNGE